MAGRTVLYVIGSLDIGGAERHLCLISPRLKQRGWEPTIYCIARRGVLADDVERQGVRVIGPQWPISPGQSAVGKFARIAASGIKLFWLLLIRRPRIAHFFLPLAYILGAPLAWIARTPVKIMSRRSLNHYQSRHTFLRRIEIALHLRMDAVLGNSRAVVEQLVRDEGCDPARVKTIYNGIDIDAIDRADARDAKYAPDSGELVLITVANLIPYKGHAELLDALGGIKRDLPERWNLWCVGRDDGILAKLEAQALRIAISEHVRFLGERTDVGALLKQAQIGILCSHEEGFSNAILEGMAAGLPMVVTGVGGNTEAVVDGRTGLVVPPRNSSALGKAILTFAREPEMRLRMGQEARKRVERQFSMDACIEQYDALYGRLVRPKRPKA